MFLLPSARCILFLLIWVVTGGRHHFWFLPNLTADVGFIDSFRPLYTHEYKGPRAAKKASDKTDEKDEDASAKAQKSDSDEKSDSEKKDCDDEEEEEVAAHAVERGEATASAAAAAAVAAATAPPPLPVAPPQCVPPAWSAPRALAEPAPAPVAVSR